MESEVVAVKRSFFSWIFDALGLYYGLLLPFAGLVCFLITLIIVIRGKGPMAGPCLIFVVHIPMLIGVFAAIQGAVNSYSVIAMSSTAPKPAEVATAISSTLVAPMVGMILMVPTYAVAVVGSLIRTLWVEPNSKFLGSPSNL